MPPLKWFWIYESIGECERIVSDTLVEKGMYYEGYETYHKCLPWRIWCDSRMFAYFRIPYDEWVTLVYTFSKHLHISRREMLEMPYYELLLILEKAIEENEKESKGSKEQEASYRRDFSRMRDMADMRDSMPQMPQMPQIPSISGSGFDAPSLKMPDFNY